MKEERYYQTLKQVSKGKIKKKRASITLGITPRHVNRLLNNYQTCGKIAFIHGNRSRKPKNKIDEETKEKVIQLYQTKYQEANFTHFTELLKSE
ncbi:MAG: transposase, partial [Streptococcaceae bacterium]|nr:transposase [Streptococcaceae bacterium]